MKTDTPADASLDVAVKDASEEDSDAELEPAIFYAVALINQDNCWLTPCGNWKGPTVVTKRFEDLKLSFQGGRPLGAALEVFWEDFGNVIDNIKWLENQITISNVPCKGFLVPAKIGMDKMLKFRHVLFEKLDNDSSDAASESDNPFPLSEWPVIHEEAAAARDKLTDTHRVVPLPAYDMKGNLIALDRYKAALGGALARISFTLSHWFIPARDATATSPATPAANTFVADVKSIRILIDPPPQKSPQKQKVSKRDPEIESPSKRSKKH